MSCTSVSHQQLNEELDNGLVRFINLTGKNKKQKTANSENRKQIDLQSLSNWLEAYQSRFLPHMAEKLSNIKVNLLEHCGLKDSDPLVSKISLLCQNLGKKETIPTCSRERLLLQMLVLTCENPTIKSLCMDLGRHSDFIPIMHAFVNSQIDENEKIDFLRFMLEIPMDDRPHFIKDVFPLLSEALFPAFQGIEIKTLYGFLCNFKIFDRNERDAFIRDVQPLLEGLTKLSDRSTLISICVSMSKDQRKAIIQSTLSLILKSANVNAREVILRSIWRMSDDERKEIMDRALPHIKAIESMTDRIEFIDSILMLGNLRDPEIWWMLEFLFQGIPQGKKIGAVLCALASLISYMQEHCPQLDISDFFLKMGRLFPQIHDGAVRVAILEGVYLFLPNYYDEFFQVLSQIVIELPSSSQALVQFVLIKNPNLKEKLYVEYTELLQSEAEAEKVCQTCEFIFFWQEPLMLSQDHPLMQLAFNRDILNANSADAKKNFSRIYRTLQEIAKKPIPSFVPPLTRLQDSQVAFDLDVFRKKAVQKPILFEQLPSGIQLNEFLQCFDCIENRLARLEGAKRQEAEEVIITCTGQPFSFLKANFVHDPYLKNLLLFQGKIGQAVSTEVAYFYSIMKYICDQSEKVPEGLFLSPRDEVLLLMSVSIAECKTGKSEGIVLAYRLLPAQYKYQNLNRIDVKEVERAVFYLDELIQQVIEDILSSENLFMQEITGTRNIQNLSHQSLYLKNLLALAVGLKHMLRFDPFTTTLYDVLLDRSLEHTLDVFYRHFTPIELVNALIKAFKRDKTLNKTLYSDLSGFLGSSADLSNVWQVNERSNEVHLTINGALEILKTAGYLRTTS